MCIYQLYELFNVVYLAIKYTYINCVEALRLRFAFSLIVRLEYWINQIYHNLAVIIMCNTKKPRFVLVQTRFGEFNELIYYSHLQKNKT